MYTILSESQTIFLSLNDCRKKFTFATVTINANIMFILYIVYIYFIRLLQWLRTV